MPSFADYFWGEKNNGFDILYHNMKYGQDSSKEFADFLRESSTLEEQYAKALSKLARSCANYSSSAKGSFYPFWQVLKTLVEKLSNLHQQLVLTWQDLMKEVQKYNEDQHKKHKAVKDNEASTSETVSCIQQTITSLQKAKETYHARCIEYEKLKRDNAAQKDLEKAEVKLKRANDDYRGLVEKYANVRNEFEVKMTESCQKFQELEENHLVKMIEFVDTYTKAWEHKHVLVGQIHEEFRTSTSDLQVADLIESFVTNKSTGTRKPGPIEFEEANLSSLPPPGSTPDQEKKEFPANLVPVLEKPKKEGGDDDTSLSPGSDTSSKSGPAFRDRALPLLPSASGWFFQSKRKNKKKSKKKKVPTATLR